MVILSHSMIYIYIYIYIYIINDLQTLTQDTYQKPEKSTWGGKN